MALNGCLNFDMLTVNIYTGHFDFLSYLPLTFCLTLASPPPTQPLPCKSPSIKVFNILFLYFIQIISYGSTEFECRYGGDKKIG